MVESSERSSLDFGRILVVSRMRRADGTVAVGSDARIVVVLVVVGEHVVVAGFVGFRHF